MRRGLRNSYRRSRSIRRDFMTLLNLIRAHAILHQATRERDDRGRVVATLDDTGLFVSLWPI